MKLSDNKVVWAYWDGPVNKIGKKCQESWKKYLPDWTVIVLNKNSIKDYSLILPDNYEELNIQLKTDIIRLNMLYKYGGVWLDYTILLKESFSWLIDFVDSQKTGNYFQPYLGGGSEMKYIPSNWMIVCPEPENINIKKQLDILVEISESYPNHSDTYIYKDVKNCVKNLSNKKKRGSGYFSMYQTVCFLNQTDSDFKKANKLPMKKRNNKYFKKYTNGGETEQLNCNVVFAIIGFILIAFIVLLCLKFAK